MLHTKFKAQVPVVQTRRFLMFSPYKSMINIRYPGWTYFWPHGHNLNKLGRDLQGDATFQKSKLYRPCGFRQEDFFTFPYILCKTCDVWEGPILATGAYFEQFHKKSTRQCYIPNIKALGLVDSD